MPFKPGFAGSIPSFSSAFGCSCHKIQTQVINSPGLVLVNTQEKPQKVFSSLLPGFGSASLRMVCNVLGATKALKA